MNEAVTSASDCEYAVFWGPITNIYSRETSSMDSRGEVIGNVGGHADRIEGQSGLECSGETYHVNKKWDDCECTSSACAKDKAEAVFNCRRIHDSKWDTNCVYKKQHANCP